MSLAMLVAGTANLFSQSMNKRLEETPQSVIENVHKAAQLLKEKGSEALAVLADPKSEFNDRDAYLFIIDVEKSLVVSNPRFPERNGGNIRKHLDWAGKYYGVELCEVAMRGGGWIEFVWPKPGTEEAAAGWRNQMNHRRSQKMGHDTLFDNYRISVGEIVREYTDQDRGEAPDDSNAYLGIK